MRDDDAALPQSTQSLPPTVVQQPGPMLDEQPAGWFSVALTMLGATAVVVLVLYGMTRPPEPQQMAASEPSQTAPAGGGAASNAGGQSQPASAAAQNPQPPTTTGQGSGGGQSNAAQGAAKGQADRSKALPASGNAAGSDTGPGAKSAPAAE